MSGCLMAEQPAIRHSDVVFVGAKSKEIHEVYQATVVSWGGHAWKDAPGPIEAFRKRVQTARDLGMRYCSGAAFRTAFCTDDRCRPAMAR